MENPSIVVQPGSNVSSAAIQRIVQQRTEEYNPQKRTPIKVSGPEMCPHCGQPIPTMPKSMLTSMNNYINEAGLVITASDDRNIWEADNGVKWYKVTTKPHEVATSKYLEATKVAEALVTNTPTATAAPTIQLTPVMVDPPKVTLPKIAEVPTNILAPDVSKQVTVIPTPVIPNTILPPVPPAAPSPVIELKTNLLKD